MGIAKIDSRLSFKPEYFSINTYEGCANTPLLVYRKVGLALDKEIENCKKQQVFRVFNLGRPLKDSVTLYISDNTPLVCFYCHDKRNESGYGGRQFTLPMENGETRIIRGPWSSRASVFNTSSDNKDLIVEVVINGSTTHMKVKDIEPYLPANIDLYSVQRYNDIEIDVGPVDSRNGVLDPLFKKSPPDTVFKQLTK